MCFKFDKPTENAINAVFMAVVLPCVVVVAVTLLMYIAFGEKPARYDRYGGKCHSDVTTTTSNSSK